MAVCRSFPNFYQPCVVMIEQNTLALLCEENRAKEQESLCCRVVGFGRTEDRLSKSVRRWRSSLRRYSIWDGTAGSWKTSGLWRWTSKTTGRPPRQVLVHLESEKLAGDEEEEEPSSVIVRMGSKKTALSYFFLLLLLSSSRCQVFGKQDPVWKRDGLEVDNSNLEQEASCYFQPFYKQLTCKCPLGQVPKRFGHIVPYWSMLILAILWYILPNCNRQYLQLPCRTTPHWPWGWNTSSGRLVMRFKQILENHCLRQILLQIICRSGETGAHPVLLQSPARSRLGNKENWTW